VAVDRRVILGVRAAIPLWNERTRPCNGLQMVGYRLARRKAWRWKGQAVMLTRNSRRLFGGSFRMPRFQRLGSWRIANSRKATSVVPGTPLGLALRFIPEDYPHVPGGESSSG